MMISNVSIASTASAGAVQNAGAPSTLSPKLGSTAQSGQSDFGELFRGSIEQVNGLEQQARAAVEGLMKGTGVDVHEAMIAAEKANAAFELALAMRNKAIQCYQSVMSMQF